MATILLTVESVNNTNLSTAHTQLFDTEQIYDIQPNANTVGTETITFTGTAFLSAPSFINLKDGEYSYTLTSTSTTRVLNIYSSPSNLQLVATGSAVIADNHAGVIVLTSVNESNISGVVTATFTTGNVSEGNTLVVSGFENTPPLQLNGNTQFVIIDTNNRTTKYTVNETVAAIDETLNPS